MTTKLFSSRFPSVYALSGLILLTSLVTFPQNSFASLLHPGDGKTIASVAPATSSQAQSDIAVPLDTDAALNQNQTTPKQAIPDKVISGKAKSNVSTGFSPASQSVSTKTDNLSETAAILNQASHILQEEGIPFKAGAVKAQNASDSKASLQSELRSAFAQDFVQSIRYNPQKTMLPADSDVMDEPWKMASNSGLLINEDGMVVPHGIDESGDESHIHHRPTPAGVRSLNKGLSGLVTPTVSMKGFIRFLQPVQHSLVTSPFGFRWGRSHQGIDMGAPIGAPILAAEGGRVIYSGWKQGYGNFIAIDHGHGMETHYAHCSRLIAHKGNRVKKGALIAKVGNSGNSTGPHLHFEVVAHGVHQNPMKYLNRKMSILQASH
jgi:murein DD-endopeptidase MepM/ murein hydrolase activator NlpD